MPKIKMQFKNNLLVISAIIAIPFFVATKAQATAIPEVQCATWDTKLTWVNINTPTAMLDKEGLDAAKKEGTAKLINTDKVTSGKPQACLNGSDLAVNTLDQGTTPSLDAANIRTASVRFLQYVLGFLAIIGVAMIIFGGLTWITSAGSEDKVGKARKVIIAAAIGLVIIAVAWTIVSFVINTARDQLV